MTVKIISIKMIMFLNSLFVFYNLFMFIIEGGFSIGIASRLFWILIGLTIFLFQLGFISIRHIFRTININNVYHQREIGQFQRQINQLQQKDENEDTSFFSQ